MLYWNWFPWMFFVLNLLCMWFYVSDPNAPDPDLTDLPDRDQDNEIKDPTTSPSRKIDRGRERDIDGNGSTMPDRGEETQIICVYATWFGNMMGFSYKWHWVFRGQTDLSSAVKVYHSKFHQENQEMKYSNAELLPPSGRCVCARERQELM